MFSVDRDLGSGYVQQWNASVQRELDVEHRRRGGLRRVEDHARRPSRHQPQSADRRAARAGRGACCSACPIRTSASSRARRRSAIRRFRVAQLLKPYPQYTTVSLYRNNVGTTIYHGVYAKLEQRFSRGLSYLVSYTRSKLMDDASSVFDASILTGPVANYPGGRQLQSPARARLLDRRHSARVRRVRGVGPSVRRRTGAVAPAACSARSSTTGR